LRRSSGTEPCGQTCAASCSVAWRDSFGENFKGSAARLFVGQRGNFLFQFGKAGQASETIVAGQVGRFGMASRGHAERYQSHSMGKILSSRQSVWPKLFHPGADAGSTPWRGCWWRPRGTSLSPALQSVTVPDCLRLMPTDFHPRVAARGGHLDGESAAAQGRSSAGAPRLSKFVSTRATGGPPAAHRLFILATPTPTVSSALVAHRWPRDDGGTRGLLAAHDSTWCSAGPAPPAKRFQRFHSATAATARPRWPYGKFGDTSCCLAGSLEMPLTTRRQMAICSRTVRCRSQVWGVHVKLRS